MTKSRIILLLVFCLASVSAPLCGQDGYRYNEATDAVFTRGMGLFREKHFAEAESIFDSLSCVRPIDQRTTASYVMAAKARFGNAEYQQSAAGLATLLKQFPESAYADDARFTLALDYMMLQWYDDAAYELLRTIEVSTDSLLLQKSIGLFRLLAQQRLTISQIRQAQEKISGPDARDLASLTLAQKYAAAGDVHHAFGVLSEVLSRPLPGKFSGEMHALESSLQSAPVMKIGALLSLMNGSTSNAVQSIAQEMEEGMTFAINEARATIPAFASLSLEVLDTGRDSVKTLSSIKELCRDPDVVAIVGPMFSNLVPLCVPPVERAGIPLLSPTAADVGIAALGKNIFQLSPDYAVRGKAMAYYAVRDLGMTSLAVVASTDAPTRSSAESFVAEAKELGATIVAVESYEKGAGDLHGQFMDVRKQALALAGQTGNPEDVDVPINIIQGIFLPTDDVEEADALASQMKYFNINAQFLGNSEWSDPLQLDQHRRDLNDIMFGSDSYLDETDSSYQELVQQFVSVMKKKPTKYTILGYDAVRLLLTEIAGGATNRMALGSALKNVRNYRALHSLISLHPGRVNTSVVMLKYRNGEFIKLKDLSLP